MTLIPQFTKSTLSCLGELYREHPELSGRIREIPNGESPSESEILLSIDEAETFNQFPQQERVELFWTHKLSNSGESIIDFLNRIKKERETYADSRNNCNDLL